MHVPDDNIVVVPFGAHGGLSSVTLSANADGTGTADQIDAGTFYITGHYSGDANHFGSDSTPVAITIRQASSRTVTMGDGPGTYDGTTHAGGSGTVTGAGGLSTGASSLSYSANADGTGTADQVDAGTYYVTAHFAGDANHLSSDGSAVAISILKADSTTIVKINGGPFIYTGLAQTPATVTVKGPGGLSLTPTASYINNVNAGTATASFTFAGDANHTGSSDSQTFDIGNASPPAVTPPANQTATERASQSFALGSFSDPDSSPWNVEINWGDNTSDTNFQIASPGSLGTQSHTYSAPGVETVTVVVTNSAGLFSSQQFQLTVAIVADAGHYAPAGSIVEYLDPAGTYSAAGAAAATTDPAGTYSAAGAAAPTTDPAGTYSAAGAAAPTTDLAGTYSGAGATAPTPASPGYFVATTGASSQTPAAPGSFVATSGATSATPALPGYYVPGSAATTQIQDPAGTYSAAGASAPTTDLAGTYPPPRRPPTTDLAGTCSEPAAGRDSSASPGYFVATTGASSQTPAAPGSFRDFQAPRPRRQPRPATTCQVPGVPPRKSRTIRRAPTLQPAMRRLRRPIQPAPTPRQRRGGFHDRSSRYLLRSGCGRSDDRFSGNLIFRSRCGRRPQHRQAISYPQPRVRKPLLPQGRSLRPLTPRAPTPASLRLLCVPGSAATTQIQDPAGTYSAAGASAPTTDPAGTYSAAAAAAATTDPAGTYSVAGASAPTTDLAGTYSAAGAAAPTPASPGYFVATTGASSQTPAAPGSFVATSDATAPTPASPGYYVPGSAATTQIQDPAGSYFPQHGATAPTTDPAGTYSPAGAAAATTDPAGTYSAAGASAPTTDLAGTYSGAGAAAPTPASPGYFVGHNRARVRKPLQPLGHLLRRLACA